MAILNPDDGSIARVSAPDDALVADVLGDVDASSSAVSAEEISLNDQGGRVARTLVELVLNEFATVSELNVLLAGYQARIVSALAGTSIVVVRVPDPGDLGALEELIASLESEPFVAWVNRAYLPELTALPSNIGPTEAGFVDHHLAIRAHAAWNARAALTHPVESGPLIIVEDAFGNGPLNNNFCASAVASDFGTGFPHPHGYHVLGIISGCFGGANDDVARATGVFPGQSRVAIIDWRLGLAVQTHVVIENRIVRSARNARGNVIVNSSNEFGTHPLPEDQVVRRAITWIEKVRAVGDYALESRMLHVAAAGNVQSESRTFVDARRASQYNAARFLPRTRPGTDRPVANLTNVLVIEDASHSGTGPHESICLNANSKRPGDLAAIGTHVWSFVNGGSNAEFNSGTSMATPQVAGLAAYVWSLRPSLTMNQVIETLRATAVPVSGTGSATACDPVDGPAPVIDAYAAVLACDRNLTHENRIRLAILDVNDDGFFNELDIELFSRAYYDSQTGNPVLPLTRDYGRLDLNGDGFTGGLTTARFDLDVNFPPQWNSVTRSILGIETSFDETALTDADILCYYAYSPLFAGRVDARDALLQNRCARCRGLELIPNFTVEGMSDDGSVLAGFSRTGPTGVVVARWENGVLTPSSQLEGRGSHLVA